MRGKLPQKCKSVFEDEEAALRVGFRLKSISPQKVVLIGPMGAGKTTLGKILAQRLGWPYIDNDSEMSALTGLTQEELSTLPVEELHQLESRYLVNLCERPAPFVGGAAGSVVDDAINMEILKTVMPIYLRIPLDEVVSRAGVEGIGRRNILTDFEEVLTSRFQRRDPVYKAVAKFVLELSDNPTQDCASILSFLEGK